VSNGGKRLNELIRKHGFRINAVSEAIGVNRTTMRKWDRGAPIGKLVELSNFTRIPLMEVIDCLVTEDDPIDTDPNQIDRTGGDSN
jgi:predicted transcriptional regulator